MIKSNDFNGGVSSSCNRVSCVSDEPYELTYYTRDCTNDTWPGFTGFACQTFENNGSRLCVGWCNSSDYCNFPSYFGRL